MKLQGSEARGIKTLQSKNSPHRQMRFWLKRLANLHGRQNNHPRAIATPVVDCTGRLLNFLNPAPGLVQEAAIAGGLIL
ncbi:hypothetical protein, partial [Bradyrhizobium liaoningense]|uniref:hypothetical protein n=1 Tax=Bradyrhizobium liaoningense TaxID=43992 RepID=UPI0024E17138